MSGLVARALLLPLLGVLLFAPHLPAAQELRLRIVQPAPGGVADGAAVVVALTVEGGDLPAGATSWPHAGQFHIALDGVDVLQTAELRFTLMGVAPGAHRLQATLEDYQAAPLASAEVPFTARNVAPGPGASWFLAGTVALVALVMFAGLLLLWLFWVRPQRTEALVGDLDSAEAAGEGTIDDQ